MSRFPRLTNPRGRGAAAGSVLIALLLSLIALVPVRAQSPLSWVITIDSGTYQPISTGFMVPNASGELLVFAEGSVRTVSLPGRFDHGWFGPAGLTNGESTSQPILSGMPYGALVRGFGNSIPTYQYLGRMGSISLQPGHVGQELKLALNLSSSDLAQLDGQMTVTIIYLPDGHPEQADLTINSTSTLPLGTGLFAQAGDHFIVMPYGRLSHSVVGSALLSGGCFGPEGLPGLNGTGQPYPDGPFGSLYGVFPGGPGFSIGDGGNWSTQIADIGQELQLNLNLGAAALAGMSGDFSVHVIRVPAPDPAQVDPIETGLGSEALFASPNPMREGTAIRFRLEGESPVRLRVYDAQGRYVRTLFDGMRSAGEQLVSWDGRDAAGQRQPAGTYFYQLSRPEGSMTGRIVVLD
jgi:hypothetical protein